MTDLFVDQRARQAEIRILGNLIGFMGRTTLSPAEIDGFLEAHGWVAARREALIRMPEASPPSIAPPLEGV